ncbi:MAG TPA: pectin acetylesterase-family hydrolase [Kofleriaceae bacterium]|nr:pectin acetylesterase-family hydrolase [Kofleriaceae bacterium]
MRIALCIVVAALTACSTDPNTGDDDIPAGCGNGTLDTGEQCDDGNNNQFDGCRPDCTAVDPLMPTAMTWQYFEIPGTKCLGGTPAGFSVNYNPASTKLAIYLEGGGACFNQYCESLFTPGPNQPGNGGIFDRTNAANPVKDWTWVYVPYCSGDVYAGQADTMVGGKMRAFYGYSNVTAFLERLVPSFHPDQVLLTGSSAGGFGAAVNYPQTQRAFGDVPVTLIDDSGPPMSAMVFPPCLQTLWKTTWGLDKTFMKECGNDCPDATNYIADTFEHMRKEFPNMNGGLFSSTGDQTIRTFAGYGWSGGYNMCKDIPNAVTAAVFTQGLDEIRTKAMAAGPNFGTYYITGSSHTILRTTSFYSTTVGGKTIPQWIQGTLDGATSHVGPSN